MNNEVISFSKFIIAKESLLRAANKPPIRTCGYTITKYPKLSIITDNEKIELSLKPKDVIKVKWLCETDENPIALRIEVNGNPVRTNFSGRKFLNWLGKYSN